MEVNEVIKKGTVRDRRKVKRLINDEEERLKLLNDLDEEEQINGLSCKEIYETDFGYEITADVLEPRDLRTLWCQPKDKIVEGLAGILKSREHIIGIYLEANEVPVIKFLVEKVKV